MVHFKDSNISNHGMCHSLRSTMLHRQECVSCCVGRCMRTGRLEQSDSRQTTQNNTPAVSKSPSYPLLNNCDACHEHVRYQVIHTSHANCACLFFWHNLSSHHDDSSRQKKQPKLISLVCPLSQVTHTITIFPFASTRAARV